MTIENIQGVLNLSRGVQSNKSYRVLVVCLFITWWNGMQCSVTQCDQIGRSLFIWATFRSHQVWVGGGGILPFEKTNRLVQNWQVEPLRRGAITTAATNPFVIIYRDEIKIENYGFGRKGL